MSGGSSGGGAPTQQTVTQTNVPDYAEPYVMDTLGRGQALSTQNPYQQYQGARVAGPTALQQQAMGSAANMQVAPQIGQATGMAGDVFNRAQSVGSYNPNTNFSAGQAPSQVGTNWNAREVHATPGYERTSTGQWNNGYAQQYMDPYMQSVVNIQKREAARNSAMMGEQNNAAAVMQGGDGALGGTRNALVEAERQRNLSQLENDIQAQGSSAAYSQALNAFNADQGRSLQSQMANQGAGLTWGQQFLQAQGMNQGRDLTLNGQNMQGQMANQGAGLTWNQQQLAAQQAGEQSRQFGAGLGMQGLQAQLGAAGLTGQLGQQQYGQQAGIAALQGQLGQQYQQTQQAALDAQYQDFVNQQMYPYRQLEFQNNLVRGNYSPNSTTSIYGGYGSPVSQAAGLGTAALGMSKMMAKGGEVQSTSYHDHPVGIAAYVQGMENYAMPQPTNYSNPHVLHYDGPSYPATTHMYADGGQVASVGDGRRNRYNDPRSFEYAVPDITGKETLDTAYPDRTGMPRAQRHADVQDVNYREPGLSGLLIAGIK